MRAPLKTFSRARSLRRAMTLPEVVLWHALRGKRLSCLRFRRQHPIGPYILDFFCPVARLAIEVDGQGHDREAQLRHDRRREVWLADHNIMVLRFSAADILKDDRLEGVLRTIESAAAPSVAAARRHLPRFAGEEPSAETEMQ